jgi:hypothetical protein
VLCLNADRNDFNPKKIKYVTPNQRTISKTSGADSIALPNPAVPAAINNASEIAQNKTTVNTC